MMSIFSGIIDTLVRFATAVVYFLVLFPRIDYGLLPAPFAMNDSGYVAFYSMIFVDIQYNSPVLLTTVSILLCDHWVRKLARDESTAMQPIARDHFNSALRLPTVQNMVEQRLDFLDWRSTKERQQRGRGE